MKNNEVVISKRSDSETSVEGTSRRAFIETLGTAGMGIVAASQAGCSYGSRIGPMLENVNIRLAFDRDTGSMVKIENKLTGESWDIHKDDFRVEAAEFTLTSENARLESLQPTSPEAIEAMYRADGRTLKVVYRLFGKNHFLEKQFTLTSPSAFGLKKVVVGQYAFAGPRLELIRYVWLKNAVYFGRAEKGGIFLGVEMPFDSSSLDSNGMMTLGYAPSLKVAANEPLVCEPIYLGVYAKEPNDAELPHLALGDAQMREQSYKAEFGGTAPHHFPLRSESAAMVAMTSAILGPRAERLAPFMDGWESEMTRAAYETHEDVQGEVRSINFAADCGMAYIAGGSIWGGAVLKVNALRDDDKLQLGDLALDVAAHARKKGIGWQLWQCLTSTNPWETNRIPQDGKRPYPPSQPYRPDRSDWEVSPTPTGVKAANCFGHQPFVEWLYERIVEAIDAGKFSQWMADGDFLGGGGTVKPVNCSVSNHSHLPGDSNYACQRNVIEMARRLRERYPDLHIFWERPAMDLGVWMMRHANCSFTVDEYARPISLPGVGAQPINFIIGDKIRTWSRLRVQMQFLPHYLDQPLAFAEPKSKGREGYAWESAGVDYVILSALACSPNQLYYLPSKAGIPQRDKLTIRKWLDWGRRNVRYLMVRRDLPEWPGSGRVDGFAHVVRDRGFVFLFNPNPQTLAAGFRLDSSIGLAEGSKFNVASVHPAKVVKRGIGRGQQLDWSVLGQTAVLLEVTPW